MEQAERQKTLKAVLHYFYQDNTKSGSHCRYSLQYHLVWIPKYRRSFLVGEIAERLKQILKEIARDYRIRIIAMEVITRRRGTARSRSTGGSGYGRQSFRRCWRWSTGGRRR
ncbi:MAG: IS200/IS605 family transposase [Pyrinomonadaceae bacterium]|nr:IS200/IS605 family transposase [Pyrinomonadaceae bacterium]